MISGGLGQNRLSANKRQRVRTFPVPIIALQSSIEFQEEREKHPGYFSSTRCPTAFQSYHWKSPMRVRIEIEKFSNLKFSFIFSDKEEGSIPASAPS
jgi:hypothetical protein